LSSKDYLIQDESFLLLINFISENNFNKIKLVGRPGSVKTTLSKKLRKELKTDLFVFVNSSILSSILKVTKRAVRGQNEYKNERLSLRLMKQILLFERKKALIESRVERNKIYYY
jgi:tRNA uridine 5-carbamoylmethylation protein Kti12